MGLVQADSMSRFHIPQVNRMSTANAPASEANIPITQLPRVFPELAALLVRPDQDEAAARKLLHDRLRATCVLCDHLVTSDELSRLAAASAEKGPSDRHLLRLSQGNCAAFGCDSTKYQVHVDQKPGEDWQKVTAALSELADSKQKSARSWRTSREERRWMLIRVVAGVLVLGLVLLIKYRRDGGRIPLLDAKPRYQVNPGVSPLPVAP